MHQGTGKLGEKSRKFVLIRGEDSTRIQKVRCGPENPQDTFRSIGSHLRSRRYVRLSNALRSVRLCVRARHLTYDGGTATRGRYNAAFGIRAEWCSLRKRCSISPRLHCLQPGYLYSNPVKMPVCSNCKPPLPIELRNYAHGIFVCHGYKSLLPKATNPLRSSNKKISNGHTWAVHCLMRSFC